MARENLARSVRLLADEQGRRVLANDEVEIGVIGHAVAFVGRPLDLDDASVRVPAATHVARHVRKQQEMINRMPDRTFGEYAVGRHLHRRRVQLDQLPELQPQRHMNSSLDPSSRRHDDPKRPKRAGATRGRSAASFSDGLRIVRHARPSRAAGKASGCEVPVAGRRWAPQCLRA